MALENPFVEQIVEGFFYANTTVSGALSKLSLQEQIPINCVIDVEDEPRITGALRNAPVRTILQMIVQPLTNYEVAVRSNVILVAPKGIENSKTFPLVHTLPAFSVTYRVFDVDGRKSYGLVFENDPLARLNIGIAAFDSWKLPQRIESFPATRRF